MEKFTASNGVEITLTNYGDETYLLGKGEAMPSGEGRLSVATVGPEGIPALREFFQHERDQELGRWRWPENPDVVVYVSNVDENRVRALSESTVQSEWSQRGSESNDWYGRAARAYFDAHPEPKPWHDAKDGEVWEVETAADGRHPRGVVGRAHGEPATFVDPRARLAGIPVTSPDVISARRIWPEVDRAVPGF